MAEWAFVGPGESRGVTETSGKDLSKRKRSKKVAESDSFPPLFGKRNPPAPSARARVAAHPLGRRRVGNRYCQTESLPNADCPAPPGLLPCTLGNHALPEELTMSQAAVRFETRDDHI